MHEVRVIHAKLELGLDPADGAAFTLVVELAAEYEKRRRQGPPEGTGEVDEEEEELLKDAVRPYVVVLDEMNLARVEYYLADVLSVLESGSREDGFTRGEIYLHGQTGDVMAAGGLRIPRASGYLRISTSWAPST